MVSNHETSYQFALVFLFDVDYSIEYQKSKCRLFVLSVKSRDLLFFRCSVVDRTVVDTRTARFDRVWLAWMLRREELDVEENEENL
mgnify:CR=1 FL=1